MISFPKFSKAAVLFQQKKELKIINIGLPQQLFYGQVLVKLIYSGICGSQLGEIMGVKGKDKYLPHLLGHEGIAEVVSKHKSVKKIRKRDKVLLHWMPAKGINAKNPKYTYKGKVINAGAVTTFNDYAVVSENRVTKIESNRFNIDYGLLLGCTASTAIGSIIKLAKLKKNKNVVICGCGAVGLSIISACNFLDVKNIVAVDVDNKKLKLAKKLGANFLLNLNEKSLKKYINQKFLNKIDYFFECSGLTKNISDGFEALNAKGKEILIGVPPHNKKSNFYTLDINLGKKLIGCKGGDFNPDKDLKSFFRILRSSKYKVKEHITKIIKLDDINTVFSLMKKNHHLGKTIIKFD